MLIQVDAHSHIEKPSHVSTDDYLEAARCMSMLEQQRLAHAREVTDRVSRLSLEHRKAVGELFGEERDQKYRARIREAGAERRTAIDSYPRDDDGRRRVRARRDEIRTNVRRVQDDLTLDVRKLQALQERRAQQFHGLFALPAAVVGATPSLVSPSSVPSEILTGRTNPWQLFTPPYAGWAFDYAWSRRGGIDPILSGIDSPTTGDIGSSERTWDNDAGDDDFLHLDYHNKVGVFFTIPVTGLVESWVEVQSVASYHQVIHEDEWGFSDGFANVGSRVTMQVASPVPSSEVGARAFEVVRGGTDFTEFALNSYVVGNSYWGHLFSDRVYTTGQSLYILFGSHEYTNETVNDVEYNDQVTYQWNVKKLWIRSSGE